MKADLLLILPVLLPLLCGVLAFVIPHGRRIQAGFNIVSCSALVLCAALLFARTSRGEILSATFGGWDSPFGIVFVGDVLAGILVLVTAIIALFTAIYAYGDIDSRRYRYGFVTFFHVMIGGVCGAFLTGDIFNLYVWFEVMLMTSFALLSLGNEKLQLYGTLKYIALNIISTVLFLSAIGMIYGATGSLNMADLAQRVPMIEDRFVLDIIAVFFVVAFGIKAAIFPLFFWLPASYHLPPVTVSGVFAGLMTKVGIYALIRLFTLIFPVEEEFIRPLLFWIAGLTMVVGALCSLAKDNLRRILSFQIISHNGTMLMGLALSGVGALGALVFYMVHDMLVKASLFFLSGVMARRTGSFYLSRMGGLYGYAPFLSALFLISVFSLAGFPPFSGFWGKFLMIQAAIEQGAWWLLGAAIFAALLTVFLAARLWNEIFWKPGSSASQTSEPAEIQRRSLPRFGESALVMPCAGLAVLIVLIGVFPSGLFDVAQKAAYQLSDPALYVAAVLPEEAIPALPAWGDEEAAP